MNGPGVAAQLTAGLGAQSGAEPDWAALATPLTNAHAPRAIPKIGVDFDMGHLALIVSVFVGHDDNSRYGSTAPIRIDLWRPVFKRCTQTPVAPGRGGAITMAAR